MTRQHLLQRLFATLALILAAAGAWLVWHSGLDPSRPSLYAGSAILAWSLLGRRPLARLLASGNPDPGRLRRDPSRYVRTTAGAGLATDISGPRGAPALIFIHDLGLDAGVWVDARAQLADRYQVIAYDLAGLGLSRGPDDDRYSLERCAGEVAELLQMVRGPSVLIGHGFGGLVALAATRDYPALQGGEIAGLVLENTAPFNPAAGEAATRAWLGLEIALSAPLWLVSWLSYAGGFTHLALRLSLFGGRPQRGWLDQAALAATRNSPGVQAKLARASLGFDASDELGQITAPALVIVGDRDRVFPPEAGAAMARLIPDARLLRAPDAGHLAPVEAARICNGAIATFADAVLMRGAHWADARPAYDFAGEGPPRDRGPDAPSPRPGAGRR